MLTICMATTFCLLCFDPLFCLCKVLKKLFAEGKENVCVYAAESSEAGGEREECSGG